MSDEIQGSGQGEIGGGTGDAIALPPGWQWEDEDTAILVGTDGEILARVVYAAADRWLWAWASPLGDELSPIQILRWIGGPEFEAEDAEIVRDGAQTVARWRGHSAAKPDLLKSIRMAVPDDWMTGRDAVEWLARVVDRGMRRMGVIGDPGGGEVLFSIPGDGPGPDPDPLSRARRRFAEMAELATDEHMEAAAGALEELGRRVVEWAKSPSLYDAIENIGSDVDAMLRHEYPVPLPADEIREAFGILRHRIGRLEAFEEAAVNHVDELAAALLYLPRGSREWEALGTALERFAEAIPDRLSPGEVVRDAAADNAEGGGRDRMCGPDAEAVTTLLEYLDGLAPPDLVQEAAAAVNSRRRRTV